MPGNAMTKSTRSTNRTYQKKAETTSSSRLRIFYVLTLVAMILSLFLRLSGARPGSAGQATGSSAARIFVFH
jgi:gamma-glutamyl:cysteine ligase YbdK (ATP-grasp superfamily)